MTSPYPNARNRTVAVITEEAYRCEGLLPHLIQTLEHAGDEVAAHKHLGQLVVVFVLAEPDRVVLWVELFPEIRDRDGLLLIGVASLEVINDKGAFGKEVEGIFLFGLSQEGSLGGVKLLLRFFLFLGRLFLFFFCRPSFLPSFVPSYCLFPYQLVVVVGVVGTSWDQLQLLCHKFEVLH